MEPVDLFRRDGVTAYSHDVQVDDAGIAWVSGDGGTRGYWTDGRHFDPLQGRDARGHARSTRSPTPAAGCRQRSPATTTGGFEHNAWRPIGRDAPGGDPRYRRGELLLATEEDFGPAPRPAATAGSSRSPRSRAATTARRGSSTPAKPFRLTVVGTWNPFEKEGSRPPGGPYDPLANFCSAHYFDVDGSTVTYAWYGEGTRFLDISDPGEPDAVRLLAARRRHRLGVLLHGGYIYTADRTRGVDVLRLTSGARREVVAPAHSARQRRFLAKQAPRFAADPGTARLCLIDVT